LLYVGRIKFYQKRTDRLIEIWQSLYKKYPDWELTIVGNGSLLNDLKQYVIENNIERVKFTGISNPAKYYQESEILCLTSDSEGLGMVLIEAAKIGCIPIAFNSFPSINEVIVNNVNGFIIDKFDMKQYMNALEELMQNDALRERLRNNSLDIFHKFHPRVVARQWVALFEEMSKNNEKSHSPVNV
jgi:glycosyltransferase involved in cell wall biosynthesis